MSIFEYKVLNYYNIGILKEDCLNCDLDFYTMKKRINHFFEDARLGMSPKGNKFVSDIRLVLKCYENFVNEYIVRYRQ